MSGFKNCKAIQRLLRFCGEQYDEPPDPLQYSCLVPGQTLRQGGSLWVSSGNGSAEWHLDSRTAHRQTAAHASIYPSAAHASNILQKIYKSLQYRSNINEIFNLKPPGECLKQRLYSDAHQPCFKEQTTCVLSMSTR